MAPTTPTSQETLVLNQGKRKDFLETTYSGKFLVVSYVFIKREVHTKILFLKFMPITTKFVQKKWS